MSQVDSFINLYFYVEPKKVLQTPLNGQDQFGSLEVLYDVVNFLLVMTRKYLFVCVQGVHCYPYI